jgi:hypothetical protein
MCETLVDVTKQIVKDATEQIAESEDAYQVRLEAHEIFARNALVIVFLLMPFMLGTLPKDTKF